jgi:hypothetical protein
MCVISQHSADIKTREPCPLYPLEKPNLAKKKRGKFVTVGSEKKKKETIGERRRWEGGAGMLSNIRREKERKENRPGKNFMIKWPMMNY